MSAWDDTADVQGTSLPDDEVARFESLARRTGAALRRAPTDAEVAAIVGRARRQQQTRLAGGVAVVMALSVGAAFWVSGPGGTAPVSPSPTSVPTITTPVVTTVDTAPITSLPFIDPSLAVPPAVTYEGLTGSVMVLGITSDNAELVATDDTGRVMVWDAATGAVINSFQPSEGTAVAGFDPTSNTVVAATSAGDFISYDLSGQVLATVPGGDLPTVLGDSGLVATADGVFDLSTGDRVHTWTTDRPISMSPDGTRVALLVPTGVEIHDAAGFDLLVDIDGYTVDPVDPVRGASAPIWSDDGTTVAFVEHRNDTSDRAGTIVVVDAGDGTEIGTATFRSVGDIALAPNGRALAVTRRFDSPAWVDLTTGVQDTLDFVGQAYDVAFGPDGRYLAARSDDSFEVVSVVSGLPLIRYRLVDPAQQGFSDRIVFSPDRVFVVTSNGGAPQRFDIP